MLQTLKNAWRTPDLRRKLLFTLLIIVLYRIGTSIPVPFVDASTFSDYFGDTIFAYLDALSGGSLSAATLFALGISPYITASIVIQLLSVAIPALGKKIQDGEAGKAFNEKLTRIVTIVLAVITGYGYYALLSANSLLTASALNATGFEKVMIAIVIVACYCAGAALVMWLGEKINEQGLGNGISVILFAGIVASLPSLFIRLVNIIISAASSAHVGAIIGSVVFVLLWIAFLVGTTIFVIWVTGSERRIPVQYAKRVVGRKMYGGQSTTLPIKLNMSGVMPIIFASSIISLPATIMTLCGVTSTDGMKAEDIGFWNHFYDFMAADSWFYPIIYVVLIILFSYFYITISFNPVEVANNLKKNGGLIPGIRQGRPTSDHIKKILNKVTLMGAFFLAIVAVVPIIISPLVVEPVLTAILKASRYSSDYLASVDASTYESLMSDLATEAKNLASSISFGGTSLLIVIGVVQETFRNLEAQLTMRNYKGFL